MGHWEADALAFVEWTLGYHPCDIGILTCASESRRGTLSGGQFDWGGRLLKSSGGVQRFVRSGRKPDDWVQTHKRAWLRDWRVEQRRKSELVIRWYVSGNAIAQRIKVTLGITGWSPPRVHIDGEVWHLDVGSSHPGAEFGPKGLAVRQLKRYASWVQNVVRQFGPYLSWAKDIWKELSLVREDRDGRTSGVPVVTPVAQLGS